MMNDKMKNLVVRTLSGAVLAVVMFSAIFWSQWSFAALFALLMLVGMHEFYNLAEARGNRPQRFIGLLTGALLFAVNFISIAECVMDARLAVVALSMIALLPFMMLVCEIFRGSETPAANIGTTLLGVVYVALPMAMMCYIPSLPTGEWNPWVMLFFVLMIWSNDVFAYLVGISIGRHRLCERISPKKSWEGFFGGLLGAAVVGYLASRHFDGNCAVWIGLSLVAAVTGVLGDLAESMFKRSAGVKDSGALIPGHGGVLDRFDAMIMAAPFVLVYMIIMF